jgi:aminoglycoside phosphotransferase (APT) family kinase protein
MFIAYNQPKPTPRDFNMPPDINRIQSHLTASWPERPNPKILSFERLNAGWESELYTFTLESGSPSSLRTEDLILRLYPGDGAQNKSLHEFHSIQQLQAAGYPVPAVHLLEDSGAVLGQPFMIMDRVPGQELWSQFGRLPREQVSALLSRFCALAVRLHAVDYRLFPGRLEGYPPSDPYFFIDRWLSMARQTVGQVPESGFKPVIEWVAGQRQRLSCERPSPNHGDFHPNNVILRPDGEMVVIDWTNFNVDDYRFDLAWTLLLVSSYEGQEAHDFIVSEYERHSGKPVAEIAAFEVCACARRLYDVSMSLSRGAASMGMRPEAVEAMEQQMPIHRKVYDLLVAHTGLRVEPLERFFGV